MTYLKYLKEKHLITKFRKMLQSTDLCAHINLKRDLKVDVKVG